jgi:hypothetical protein
MQINSRIQRIGLLEKQFCSETFGFMVRSLFLMFEIAFQPIE